MFGIVSRNQEGLSKANIRFIMDSILSVCYLCTVIIIIMFNDSDVYRLQSVSMKENILVVMMQHQLLIAVN